MVMPILRKSIYYNNPKLHKLLLRSSAPILLTAGDPESPDCLNTLTRPLEVWPLTNQS